MSKLTPRVALIAVTLIAACAPGEDPLPDANSDVEPHQQVVCEGPKCDGLSDRFRDAYDNMRAIDLDDLTVLSAGLASEQLNDQLGDIPFSNLELSPTALYGQREEVLGQIVIHDLNTLGAGLTRRFGEDAFSTRIVETRKRYAAANDIVWSESHFAIGPDLGHGWSFDAGDSAVGTVGFLANGTVETVVIAPHEERTDALVDAPLSSIKETRGWVMPRDIEDVNEMAPGESLSMRADGALGLNLGVGVPFLVGTVSSTVALHARLSFGARVAISGKLDVQLVRGEGSEAWVDVGVDEQTVRDFALALTTGFGLSGLPEVELDLGPVDMSLTSLADRALRKQLDKHLAPSASATSSTSTARLTVARFRFDLSQIDDAMDQAISQAMRGDIRLAQALANRGDAGVAQELDLTKDARSEASYVGFRFLGMEFYRASNFDTGTVTIEQDGENQTLLFSELEEKSGLFFTDREWALRKLVSLKSRDGELTDASVNARVTIRESDSFLSRDQMLDHVDPMVGYLTGYDPLWNDIGALTDELAEYVDDVCGRLGSNPSFAERREFDECLESIPTMPEVQARRTTIEAAIDEAISNSLRGGFAPEVADVAQVAGKLLRFKLELSTRNDRPDVGFYGPNGKMVTQIRFSNDALEGMMIPGRHEDFRVTTEQVLRLMAADRISDLQRKQDRVDDYVDNRADRLDDIAQLYGEATVDWADLQDIAAVSLDGERIGNFGHMVLIPTQRPEDLDLASIAEHKGKIVEQLVPDLVDLAEAGIFRDLGQHEEFVIAYALLWMAEPSEIEVLANYVFDDDDDLAFDDLDVYARGTSPLIDAGQFDLDELLGSN